MGWLCDMTQGSRAAISPVTAQKGPLGLTLSCEFCILASSQSGFDCGLKKK